MGLWVLTWLVVYWSVCGEGDELAHFPYPSGAGYVLFPSSPLPGPGLRTRCRNVAGGVSGLPAPMARPLGGPARALHFCGKEKQYTTTSCLVLLNPCPYGWVIGGPDYLDASPTSRIRVCLDHFAFLEENFQYLKY